MGARTTAKNGLVATLDLLKVPSLISPFRRKRLLVLCYHGVVSEHAPSPGGGYAFDTVSVAEFRNQLTQVSRWFRFVSLNEALTWLDRGSSVAGLPPALVTFDDGYRNNLTLAAPVLRELGIPAAFYLTTNYVGTGRLLWPAEVGARISQSPGAVISLPGVSTDISIPADSAAAAALSIRLRSACKKLPDTDRTAWLDRLRAVTTLDRRLAGEELHDFLSWDEARKLAALGFAIGSHTLEHPILSRLAPEALTRELSGSKVRLEAELNMPVTSLAYPNGGAEDTTEAVRVEARRVGYDHAFAVGDRFQSRNYDRMAIRRMIVPGRLPDALFRFICSGLRDLLSSGE